MRMQPKNRSTMTAYQSSSITFSDSALQPIQNAVSLPL